MHFCLDLIGEGAGRVEDHGCLVLGGWLLVLVLTKPKRRVVLGHIDDFHVSGVRGAGLRQIGAP
ncbi:hypothetical protein ACFLSJ_09395 [Verrucomicrobiota bacterium]